jgi:hypothetical protein
MLVLSEAGKHLNPDLEDPDLEDPDLSGYRGIGIHY